MISEFIRWCIGTLCSISIGGVSLYRLWRWNRQSVSKRRHIKFRCRRTTEKKEYKIHNKVEVWNQEYYKLFQTSTATWKRPTPSFKSYTAAGRCRFYGVTNRSHLQGSRQFAWPLEMEQRGCPETAWEPPLRAAEHHRRTQISLTC